VTPGPVTLEASFEPWKSPFIEGFSLTVYSNPEGFKEKFLRKTRKNLRVPIGCLGTAAGLYCFHQGHIAAILLGLVATAMKSRP
uniref:HIG1 hypoxia inducible domain family member 2B n=1 Tax=Mandrillus leucophaeus TaxID=9568 RepID=A0A2K5YRD8_MANLE